MAEIEFSVLSRLKQRLARRRSGPLVKERNVAGATIHWRFNTQAPEPNSTAFTLLIPRLTEY